MWRKETLPSWIWNLIVNMKLNKRAIEEKFGFKLIRFNPDGTEFDIFGVIKKAHYHCKKNMIDKYNQLKGDTEKDTSK